MSGRRRILITGGSGFMGTNAVEYFRNREYEVLNVDIKAPQNEAHASVWSQCDILNAERLKRLFRDFDPDYLLHLAARTDLHEKKHLQGYAANTQGVVNTIDAARGCHSLRRALFASSRMVCRIDYRPQHDQDYCPPNLYGESKVRTEEIVRGSALDCEWVIVRPTSIWGPWFAIPYKIFFETIERRLYFHPSRFNPKKSFGFVGNTMHEIDRLLDARAYVVNRQTLYLCDYPPLRVRHWADLIRRRMKLPPVMEVPYPILKGAALAGDVLAAFGWQRVPITSSRLSNLVIDMVYDTSALESICGELPYSLDEGVRHTVEWLWTNR